MVCCFMWLSLSIADHHSVDQQHSQSSLENEHHDDDKHYHTQHAAVFAGVTINLHTEENSPTLGADWEYRLPLLDHGMGLGMIIDLVLAEATEFIVASAVFLHPFAGLKFAVAPGLNSLSRIILGRRLPLQVMVSKAPRFSPKAREITIHHP